MVHGVVAPGVSSAADFVEEVWIATDVVAYEEECGFDVVLVEDVEDPGGDFGDGSVVEGEVDEFSATAFYSPDCFGEE